MSTTGRPCYSSVLRPPWSVRAHLPHPYPIPPPSHPLLCRGREIGGRVLTVSIRCTAESSAFRRASIVDGGSRPLAALRGVGRFIVAGRLPISGKTVGRTGGAIFLASFHIINAVRTKGTGEGRRSGRWSRAGAETLGAVFRGVRQGGCEGSHQGAFLSAFRSIGEEGARGSRALRDVSRACSCDRTPLQSE